MSVAWAPPAAEIPASDHAVSSPASDDTPRAVTHPTDPGGQLLALGISPPTDLEHAPPDVHRVLGDLGRLLLAIPSYRVEPVVVGGVPMAAIRVERRDSNPVLIAVCVP